jgi:hypothetical protein
VPLAAAGTEILRAPGSRFDAPSFRLAALEEFNEQIIRPGDHDISEFRPVGHGIPELKSVPLHFGYQSIEIVRFNSQVMHRASAARLWRLIIDMDERASNSEAHVSYARRLLVPDNLGAKHPAEKFNGCSKVGRKDVYVIKACAHDPPRRSQQGMPTSNIAVIGRHFESNGAVSGRFDIGLFLSC